MSKVDELRQQYPSISKITFDKFVIGDKTPTKKYLEYFLKMWFYKNETGCPKSTKQLIDLVNKFDEYLPYIEIKDIHARFYLNYTTLNSIVERAEQIKEEKTFIKEDHVIIYNETETYILLKPKTHRGSLRYGAGTKWCTSSKKDETTFNGYVNRGLLIYVIRKDNLNDPNYNKIALNLEYSETPYNSIIDIFTASDIRVSTDHLAAKGWTYDEIRDVFFCFMEIFRYQKLYKVVNGEINQFLASISNLDFNKFVENLSKLENTLDDSYISNIKEKLDKFINQIQTTTHAIRQAKS